MNEPRRKSRRLNNYDYGQNGYYFVTVCTHKRRRILSEIVVGQGLAPAEVKLTDMGKIAEEQLLDLENRYKGIKIEKYVIMPNHIHAVIVIDNTAAGASPCPTLSAVVGTFKSLATRICRQNYEIDRVFQESFYDHIIRNEKDFLAVYQYIETNPLKWENDEYYT